MTTTHTPTPWTLDTHKYTDDGNKCRTFVIHGPDYAIGRIQGPFSVLGKDQEKEANAAFIVRACNAHYESLEALEDLVKAHDAGMGANAVALRIDMARAAISKARGE